MATTCSDLDISEPLGPYNGYLSKSFQPHDPGVSLANNRAMVDHVWAQGTLGYN